MTASARVTLTMTDQVKERYSLLLQTATDLQRKEREKNERRRIRREFCTRCKRREKRDEEEGEKKIQTGDSVPSCLI